MKSIYLVPFVLTLPLPFVAAQTDITPPGYTNFIKQIQLPSGVVVSANPANIASSGVGFVGAALTTKSGSRFELHTVRASPFTSTLLATTTVDVFKPFAGLTITTGDPYNSHATATGPRRTRADMPFTVTTTVSGLEADLTRPACFRFINRYRGATSGSGNASSTTVPTGTLIPERVFSTNETFVDSYRTSLTGAGGVRFAMGTETFATWSLADNTLVGQEVLAKVLDTKTVEIWPVSTGRVVPWDFSGVVEQNFGPNQIPKNTSAIMRTKIPRISFDGFNLYPLADTYLEYYAGPYVPNQPGVRISGPSVNSSDASIDTPNFSTPLDFNSRLSRDGMWTVVLVTFTNGSFLDRRELAIQEIPVDRSITVNTNLTTSE
jgi:hypothetical protein